MVVREAIEEQTYHNPTPHRKLANILSTLTKRRQKSLTTPPLNIRTQADQACLSDDSYSDRDTMVDQCSSLKAHALLILAAWNFRLRVEEGLSPSKTIVAGVLQCSILSPLLFTLFIRLMPKPANTKLSLYADDTAIVSTAFTEQELCQHLNSIFCTLKHYFEEARGIKLNADKTAAVLFTRSA
ncbi:hypothetical protein PR048_033461 [Dryococelus australis]|uniref:Reverse transcriptase domain-containing protein n=1 Tax=Dryococelus australis TaxID=614101 RepID=A0ABQ9G195_9NEOP|nr:hypothetical protein PR048_033461 [Dryococelus australis]